MSAQGAEATRDRQCYKHQAYRKVMEIWERARRRGYGTRPRTQAQVSLAYSVEAHLPGLDPASGPFRYGPPGFPSQLQATSADIGIWAMPVSEAPPPSALSLEASRPGCQACFFSRKGKSQGLTSSLSGPGPTFSRPPLCSASTASSLKGSSCPALQHGCGESAGDGWGQGTAYDLHIRSRPGVLSCRSCLHWSCQGLGLSEFLSRLKNGTHLSLTLVSSQPKSVLTLGQKEPWSGHCYCVAYRNLELPGF